MIGLGLLDAAFLAVASAVSSSPATDTNLVLWVKADAMTFIQNAQCTNWPDSSGGTTLVRLTTGPKWVTNQVNGKPAFNTATAKASWICNRTIGNNYHILAVATFFSSDTANFVCESDASSFAYVNSSADTPANAVTAGGIVIGTSPTCVYSGFGLIEWVNDNGSWESFCNGVSLGTATGNYYTSNSAMTGLLGNGSYAAYYLIGRMAEIKVYTTAGDASERATRRATLNSKYALY